MEKKQNIVEYRKRLDKTLNSLDLTDDQMLKQLIKSQLPRSSQSDIQGYEEKLEIKTAEVSNLLDMMRSASVDGGFSNTSRTGWKLKQDTEEFRVMYREGPEGTPFHTLMVEGYVDGPVDVCLCLSWESSLYKKWWPQFTIPTFKLTKSDCLQKVHTGDQISLVRMKLSWPLSTREAIVHFYLFEYFQDDLIVVLLKSVCEPNSINETIDGFNSDTVVEAKDVVRIDLVGGYVLQKVTSERSYFRTMANLDIKLDFVPPSLINFISRQLIGSGFRLYQKAVASMMNNDKDICKALGDSFYVRIREALYGITGSNAKNGEELKQVASIHPAEELGQNKQDVAKDIHKEDRSNQNANDYNGEILDAGNEEVKIADSEEILQIEKDVNKVHDISIEEGDTWTVLEGKRNCEIVDSHSKEIVEEDDEEIIQIEEDHKKVHDIPIEEDDTRSVLKGKRKVYISPDVKQALETLERAISVVRKYGFNSHRSSFSFGCMEKGGTVDSCSAKFVQPSAKKEVSIDVSSSNLPQETSEDLHEIENLWHTGTNPNSKEVNYNKVVPAASPEQNLSRPIEASRVDSYTLKNETTLDETMCDNEQFNRVDSYTLKNETTLDETMCDNEQFNSDACRHVSSDDPTKSSTQKKLNTLVTQGISSDVSKQSRKRKNYRYCCFFPLAKEGQ